MFLRANASFACSLLEFRPAVFSIPHLRDALVHVASTAVEVLLLSLAEYWLERVVSFFFLSFLFGRFADTDYMLRSGSL
jgi:hypothetical protein